MHHARPGMNNKSKRRALKPALAGLAAAALLLGGGAPAAADGMAGTETVDTVTWVEFDGAVSASVVLVQTSIGNVVVERNVVRTNTIIDSFNGNRGIVQFNFDSGILANQANILVVAVGKSEGSILLDLSAVVATKTVGNSISVTGGSRENRIENSFNGNSGVVQVNMNAGILNHQRNVVVIGNGVAVGPDLMALGDKTLAAVMADNDVDIDPNASRSDIVTNSFNGFKGIAAVTMTSGDGNAVTNMVGVSVTRVDIR